MKIESWSGSVEYCLRLMQPQGISLQEKRNIPFVLKQNKIVPMS